MRDKILTILGEVSGADGEIYENLEIDLFESGMIDSLGMIEILVDINNELGINVKPTEIDRSEINTPNKLVAFLESK